MQLAEYPLNAVTAFIPWQLSDIAAAAARRGDVWSIDGACTWILGFTSRVVVRKQEGPCPLVETHSLNKGACSLSRISVGHTAADGTWCHMAVATHAGPMYVTRDALPSPALFACCLPAGDQLGFVLQHRHLTRMSDLASLPFPEALKGPDRMLAAAMTQAGLKSRWAAGDAVATSKVA